MRKLILIVSCVLALALIGCAPKETESATPATTAEAVTETAAATTETMAATTDTAAATTDSAAAAAPLALDAQISAKLVEAFGDDAKAITVAVADGKATLTGKVTARSTQELAEQVALYFPEVKDVDNKLEAEKDRGLGKGQLKDEAIDAALESAAKGALAKEIGEHAKDVKIEVAGGVVALSGTVPDAARHKLATDAIAKVKDVTKVVDLLRIK